MTNVTAVEQLYPQCTQAGVDLAEVFVAVHATAKGGRLGSASITRATFGMCMWLALVIHIIGVEIYVRIMFSACGLQFFADLTHEISRSERPSPQIDTGMNLRWSVPTRTTSQQNPSPPMIARPSFIKVNF
jgi:hypothetical protein